MRSEDYANLIMYNPYVFGDGLPNYIINYQINQYPYFSSSIFKNFPQNNTFFNYNCISPLETQNYQQINSFVASQFNRSSEVIENSSLLMPQAINKTSTQKYQSTDSNQSSEEKDGKKKISRTDSQKENNFKIFKNNSANYYWSDQQNQRYCEFLKLNPGIFDLSVSQKKNLKVNVLMSKKVKTRSPQQCHSHHQKMIKKFQTAQKIIANMIIDRQVQSKSSKKQNKSFKKIKEDEDFSY